MAFILLRQKPDHWEFLSAWNDGTKVPGSATSGEKLIVPGLKAQEIIDRLDGRYKLRGLPQKLEARMRAKGYELTMPWDKIEGFFK